MRSLKYFGVKKRGMAFGGDVPGEKEQASNNVERGFIMFGMGLLFFCCFSLDFSCGFL